MKLISITEFREKYFSERSRPQVNTVKGWIKKGIVPGRTVGGMIYIDETRWRQSRTGNELADRVLSNQ